MSMMNTFQIMVHYFKSEYGEWENKMKKLFRTNIQVILRLLLVAGLLAGSLALSTTTLTYADVSHPSVTTFAAAQVASTTATLNSFVNPNGAATTAWFRYSTANPGTCGDSFGTRVPASGGVSLGEGGSDVGYSYPISGLTPQEVYYFCVIAQNSQGTAYGSVLSFFTPPPLTVTTTAAAQVTSTTATLSGFVNPTGSPTIAWFRYSMTDPNLCYDAFGTRVPANGGTSLGSGSSDVDYSYPISGLIPGEVYYFCVIAENSHGKAYGSVLSFTTPPSPLTVTTFAAAQVTSTTATLNSFVTPNGLAAITWFRYSTADPIICYDAFGTRVPASGGTSMGSGSNAVSYSYPISGLTPGTVYYFCAIAQNNLGMKYGSVLSFTTALPPADSDPPATTITLTPGAPNGSNGWYTSGVHVTISGSDGVGGSGVAETHCVLDPVSAPASFDDLPGGCAFTGAGADVTSEGAHTIYAASKDNAGNEEPPKSQTFKLDMSRPSAHLSAVGTMGNNGWYVGDVTITTSGTDSVSNPVTCTSDQSQAVDTAAAVFNGSCTNDADLTMNAAPLTIKRDATAPVVAVTGVTNGAAYQLGAVPAVGCSTTDAVSGVETSAVLSLSGGPVGSITATCSGATDNAGNAGQASVTFNVVYNWTGFFQPVDNPGSTSTPVFNQVKAGRSIPIKFSLGGDQGLNILAAGYPQSETVSCGFANTIDDVEQTVSANGNSLTYDATANQYILVWKTETAYANSCRKLTVKLLDGTEHNAYFRFTR